VHSSRVAALRGYLSSACCSLVWQPLVFFLCFGMTRWVFLRPFVVLFGFSGKPVFQTAIYLSDFPQDQKQQDADCHQYSFDIHLDPSACPVFLNSPGRNPRLTAMYCSVVRGNPLRALVSASATTSNVIACSRRLLRSKLDSDRTSRSRTSSLLSSIISRPG
jgi:hypothetical protein